MNPTALDATPLPAAAGAGAPCVDGAAILYRLFDVGYAIRLDRALERLFAEAPERRRPVREGAQTIVIPNPPVTVSLGAASVDVLGRTWEAELSAQLFDFGVVSLRARVAAPSRLGWGEFAAFGAAMNAHAGWTAVFEEAKQGLLRRLADAVERPGEAPLVEEYMVLRVSALAGADGVGLGAEAIREADVARLLSGETRPLSASARSELLSKRFSYFEDDLTVVTWNAALVLDPEPGESDVEFVLEFANAQLLELRFFDAQLDAELPRMSARIAEAREGFHVLGRRFSRLLGALQTRVADATELLERIENAFKVTDDVFLGRIYGVALEMFGGRAWRSGIDRKIAILRDSYVMLNAEAQALRSEVLEIVVVLLIVVEVVMAALRG